MLNCLILNIGDNVGVGVGAGGRTCSAIDVACWCWHARVAAARVCCWPVAWRLHGLLVLHAGLLTGWQAWRLRGQAWRLHLAWRLRGQAWRLRGHWHDGVRLHDWVPVWQELWRRRRGRWLGPQPGTARTACDVCCCWNLSGLGSCRRRSCFVRKTPQLGLWSRHPSWLRWPRCSATVQSLLSAVSHLLLRTT